MALHKAFDHGSEVHDIINFGGQVPNSLNIRKEKLT